MVDLLSNFLQKLDESKIEYAVHFIIGTPIPSTDSRTLDIGKCFKGLTDQEIQDMTKALQKIKMSEKGRTVTVKPKIVLEIAFEEIQKSQRYESGFALRFARIVRIREDKGPDDVDSIDKIRKMYEQQSKRKAL